jgi:hypothetical protein
MIAGSYILLLVFCISCDNKKVADTLSEAADPDTYDMSVWKDIDPGIYSGFGSIDVAYLKSIPPEGNITESIELQGWKGERVSCKLLVWSAGSEENISIKASGFSNDNYKIDKESTSTSAIKYVLVDEFLNELSNACGPRDKDKIPAHISPDLLTDASSFTINTPGARPVWISVDIPSDAPAGIYEGTVFRQSASVTVNHTITLEVLNKLLPDPSDWSFHLDLWQNPYAVARYHGVELWSKEHLDLLRPLLTKLANAGQKCITTTLIDKPWDGGRIPNEAIQSRKESGLITTYYVACGIPKPNNFTFSPPSESCFEGWIAAAMGFDGFLRWAYNSWPENPVIDSRYTQWPSGDTYLVYPDAQSSVRFERLREGIQDYEKIRILREELADNRSPEATVASVKLNDFLGSIDNKILDKRLAADVINEGKQLVYEIVRSVYSE